MLKENMSLFYINEMLKEIVSLGVVHTCWAATRLTSPSLDDSTMVLYVRLFRYKKNFLVSLKLAQPTFD